MNDFYVYLHRRKSDGAIFYVGKGRGNRAWVETGRNQHWQNVANKHGCDVSIYRDKLAEACAFSIERILIASIGRDNLCNLTDGGEGASGFVRPREVVERMAAMHRGMKRSEQSRRRMSEAQLNSTNRPDNSGDKNPSKRQDVRDKMSAARKGRFTGDDNVSRRPDVRAKLSSNNAMNDPANRAKVSAALKGRKAPWIMGDNHPNKKPAAREHLSKLMKGRNAPWATGSNAHNSRSVVCDNGLEFDTITDASKWVCKTYSKCAKNIVSKISEACKGRRKTAYGHKWKFK
jgi:hypothetical protein